MATEIERSFVASPTNLEIQIQPVTKENSPASVESKTTSDSAMSSRREKRFSLADALLRKLEIYIKYNKQDRRKVAHAVKISNKIKEYLSQNFQNDAMDEIEYLNDFAKEYPLPHIMRILTQVKIDYANVIYTRIEVAIKFKGQTMMEDYKKLNEFYGTFL